jgi:protocatechuate 3,4-dioxygenase beta subunit
MQPEIDPDPDPDHVTGFDRRLLIRSAALLGLGSVAASSLARRASALAPDLTNARPGAESACRLAPTQTAGPYWINLQLLRQDITEGLPGLPFLVGLRILQQTSGECVPVQGAIADLWHASPAGTYSGFANQGTAGQTWLRGIQVTSAFGDVMFRTIYPGWYPGRTTHLHLRVVLNQQVHLTTQLYFDDAFSTQTYLTQPYLAHGPKPVSNQQDGIFDSRLVMPIWPRAGGEYLAAKTIIVV